MRLRASRGHDQRADYHPDDERSSTEQTLTCRGHRYSCFLSDLYVPRPGTGLTLPGANGKLRVTAQKASACRGAIAGDQAFESVSSALWIFGRCCRATHPALA